MGADLSLYSIFYCAGAPATLWIFYPNALRRLQHTTTSNEHKNKKILLEFNGHVLFRLTNNKIQLYRFSGKHQQTNKQTKKRTKYEQECIWSHAKSYIFWISFSIINSQYMVVVVVLPFLLHETATEKKIRSVWLDIKLETIRGAQLLLLSVAICIPNAYIYEWKCRRNTIQWQVKNKESMTAHTHSHLELILFTTTNNLWQWIVLCAANYGCQWCTECFIQTTKIRLRQFQIIRFNTILEFHSFRLVDVEANR